MGLFLAATTYAQTSVDFKSHYEPNTIYHQTQRQVLRLRFNLDSSSQEIRAQLDSAKPEGLAPRSSILNLKADVTTGRLDPSTGRMPIRMDVLDMENEDSSKAQPFKAIFGSVAPDSLPVFDSVATDVPSDAFKRQTLSTMNGIFAQLRLPNARISKGHTFTYSNPVTIPVGPSVIKMKLQATYRLVDVKAGIAHFTDVVRIDMDLGDAGPAQSPLRGSGGGTGTVDYDVRGQYIRAMYLKYDMDMGIHQGPLIMHLLIAMEQQIASVAEPAPKE